MPQWSRARYRLQQSDGRARRAGSRSAQLADMALEQGPTSGTEFLAPGRIDRRHAGAEGRLVDLVEDHAALGERGAEARIEPALVVALQAHELGGIALDDGLDVLRQPAP